MVGHLECPIGKILAMFDLQVNPDAFCKVSSQLAFRFRRRSETNRFLWWHPSWSSDLAIFDSQVTQMLPTKFQVNWPLNSGAEAKKIFSSWPSWQPIRISDRNDFNIFWSTLHPGAWISDRNDFSSFWSTNHLNAFYKVSSQLAFRFKRRSEDIDFKDSGHGRHLGFPIGIILVFFLSSSHPDASYPVSGQQKRKKYFQDGRHGSQLGFLIGMILTFFDLHVTLMLPTNFRFNWLFGWGEARI